MKKTKLILATTLMSISISFPAFAGTWTHTHNSGNYNGTYDNLWFYLKDDGNYAKEEWIHDNDGTWYWINNYNQLPSMEGVSTDGYLYNSLGAYVDVSDGTKKYLTRELSSQTAEGMTYDQVINILGKEHDVFKSKQSTDGTIDYLHLNWYSSDAKGRQDVILKKGIVTLTTLSWN